jgi:hypothetical protein
MQDNTTSTVVVAATGTNASIGVNTDTVSIGGPDSGGTYALGFRLDGVSATHEVDLSAVSHNFSASATATVMLRARIREFGNPLASYSIALLGRDPGSGNAEAIFLLIGATTTTLRISTADGTLDFALPSVCDDRYHTFLIAHEADNDWRVAFDGVESSSGPQKLTNQLRVRRIGSETIVVTGSFTPG